MSGWACCGKVTTHRVMEYVRREMLWFLPLRAKTRLLDVCTICGTRTDLDSASGAGHR